MTSSALCPRPSCICISKARSTLATLSELSRRHPTPLTTTNNRYTNIADSGRVFTEEEARELYNYTNFTGFLLAFKAVTERLRTADDYELVAYRMMQKLAEQNVRHAEVYVSVGVVHWRGGDFPPLFEGLERGRERGERDFGVSVSWIFDAVRHFGVDEARRVVEEAIRSAKTATWSASDSAATSAVAAPEQFREVYHLRARTACASPSTLARPSGRNRSGERCASSRPTASVTVCTRSTIPDLVRYLAEQQIPVEVCISSNVLTGCCTSLEQHPVRKLFDAGVLVTLNTDDPEMFHTTLNREYQIAQQVFGFSDDELRQLAENSFRAAFSRRPKR